MVQGFDLSFNRKKPFDSMRNYKNTSPLLICFNNNMCNMTSLLVTPQMKIDVFQNHKSLTRVHHFVNQPGTHLVHNLRTVC